jgi:hypothetical protein
MLCRYLEDKVQGQSIYIDRWRKRIHLLHGLKAFHNFDQLNADIRTDDWNVMGSKETASALCVDVIHQSRTGLPGLSIHDKSLIVFARCHRECPRHH